MAQDRTSGGLLLNMVMEILRSLKLGVFVDYQRNYASQEGLLHGVCYSICLPAYVHVTKHLYCIMILMKSCLNFCGILPNVHPLACRKQ